MHVCVFFLPWYGVPPVQGLAFGKMGFTGPGGQHGKDNCILLPSEPVFPNEVKKHLKAFVDSGFWEGLVHTQTDTHTYTRSNFCDKISHHKTCLI